MSIFKSSKTEAGEKMGSQRQGLETKSGLNRGCGREQAQDHLEVGNCWGQSGRDCELPPNSSHNKNALTHRMIVSIGY